MSTRDEAALSAAERAALAGLESKAEADDPHLAAHLRGSRRIRQAFRVPPGLIRLSRTWVGPLAAVVGLATMILALSTSTLVALVGALLLVGGILLSSGLVKSGLGATVHVLPGPRSGDQDPAEGSNEA